MKRVLVGVMVAGLAAGFVAEAAAQLRAPVFPSWTALVSPEMAKGKNLPEPSVELKACFDTHRAALFKKPEAVSPLVADYLGADPLRRDCALAAEVDHITSKWRLSSSSNSYGPLMTFMSNQNKSLAKKSELEKCQGRQFIFDAATTFNDMVGGMVPAFTYEWVKPVAGAPCVTASQ